MHPADWIVLSLYLAATVGKLLERIDPPDPGKAVEIAIIAVNRRRLILCMEAW